jgi:DNA polymerase-3 subunit delta'
MADEPDHFSEDWATQTKNGGTSFKQITTSPCGDCRSCRKIQSENHPDIILVKPSGSFIKIRQIRDLCYTLSMKPYEARLRIVIIPDAQIMTASAGNALLKVLEEPPDRTILILTAVQTSDLLPTIVSRCQYIRFNPITDTVIETLLLEAHGVHPDDANKISNMANGSVSKALSIINSMHRVNWINRRDWLIDEMDSLSHRPIDSLLAFAERLSKNKELLDESLEVIKSWFRDLVVFKYNPEKIINKDLSEKIRQASKKIEVATLLSKIDVIQKTQKDIQSNTNLRLSLEVLIMQLAGDQK